MVRTNKRWEQVTKDRTTLDKLVQAFEVRNRASNRSPKTVAWYSNNLRLFLEFLQREGDSLELGEVGLAEVRQFIVFLQSKNKYDGHPLTPTQNRKLSPQTIRAHVETLKAFFTWLHDEEYTSKNKLEKLEFPKVPRKFVEILTHDEVKQVLACTNQKTELGCRNAAVIMTLLDTGLRCAEVCGMTIQDAHLDQGYLKVMGKGSKERVVPIGASVQKVLLRYFHHFRPEPARAGIENFFLSFDGMPVTPDGVAQMIRRVGQTSGVPKLHAHLCRHTFATNYLINGGDVFSLQQILGHTTLEMVRRYVSLASSQVAVQHRKYSPMDWLGGRGVRRPLQRKPVTSASKPMRRGQGRLTIVK